MLMYNLAHFTYLFNDEEDCKIVQYWFTLVFCKTNITNLIILIFVRYFHILKILTVTKDSGCYKSMTLWAKKFCLHD